MSTIVAGEDQQRFILLMASGAGVAIALALIGFAKRLIRWVKLQWG